MSNLVSLGITALIIIAVLLIGNKLKEKKDDEVLNMRKKQAKLNLRENALKKKMELAVEKKAKVSKKFKIETMCLQAGYKISYGEYKIISRTSAIILPIITLIITVNIYLSLIMIFVGYLIPGQFISFVRNRRLSLMEKQVGSFLNLVTERYKTQRDITISLEECLSDFKGQEPMYSEIRQTVIDLDIGVTPIDALDSLARRTGSKYIKRFKDFYAIVSDIGTDEARDKILGQAFLQYEENRQIKETLNKEISGPKRDAYLMLGFVPVVALYQIATSDTYVDFMLHTITGKIGSAIILAVIMGALWFINAKIGAPLE